MDVTETLEYLLYKRRVVAPVTVAEENVREKQEAVNIISQQWQKPMGIMALLVFVFFALQSHGLAWIIVICLASMLFYRYKKLESANVALSEAKILLEEEAANPEYQQEMVGFPRKFYNYRDINRLYYLIEEGRARELKEAYNLLEQQQFNETQISMQNEMLNLQQDIASSSKISAVASTLTAYNTFRINSKL